jgi:hypothetical protein
VPTGIQSRLTANGRYLPKPGLPKAQAAPKRGL